MVLLRQIGIKELEYGRDFKENGLVNQLLDFQKVQTGSRQLEIKSLNVLRFCQVCADYFVDACGLKGIHFSLSYDGKLCLADDVLDDLILVEAEVDALEKVLFNYLSNALKYNSSLSSSVFLLLPYSLLLRTLFKH